jgi:hypothetical protein
MRSDSEVHIISVMCSPTRYIPKRLSVGARHCSTYARNFFPVIAPSMVCDALMPYRRSAATKVIVFQCPCGTWPTSRSPWAQRPYSRTISVLAEVSSMNTSRAGSNMPCSRIQRRRARATSARSCSAARSAFFKCDLVALKEPPYRRAAAGNLVLAHRTNHLVQRQVRLFIDQSKQKLSVLLQRRDAPASQLGGTAAALAKALHPGHRRAGTDFVMLGRLTFRPGPKSSSSRRGFSRRRPKCSSPRWRRLASSV